MSALGVINKVLLKVAQRAEVMGAVVIMAIVFIFIVPLPTWLVDILIALNICISCLLIVLALYLPGPLAFSSFPSILLTLGELRNLAPGAVLGIAGYAPGMAGLYYGDRPIGQGQLVDVDGRLGLQLSRVIFSR